ncbi:MAG: prepilin-type N-terminal cleavage/methylation domain-containing protein, partial [Burkholderiaceae bacterium]|nr:prepilin-type N-terminal cleavage/methylation domain-containing protein [Burkholderiaceae bacterium]
MNTRSSQTGFTMIELTLALAMLTLLSAFAAKAFVEHFQEGLAQATANYLLTLKSGLDACVLKEISALAANAPIAGFSDPLAPTVAELKSAGCLAVSLPELTPFKQTLSLRIHRSAACPNAGCLISAQALTNSPVALPGADNAYLAMLVRSQAQGYGMASSEFDAARLTGLLCEPQPNPLGSVPNVLGVCSVVNGGLYAQFVRQGDDRATQLNNSLSVLGTLTAASLVLNAGATAGGPCTGSEGLRQRAEVPGALLSCQSGVWTPVGARLASPDMACPTAGELGIAATGQALVCKAYGGSAGGFFVPASHLLSDFVFLASSRVTDGDTVPKPVCATVGGHAGTPLVFLLAQTEGTSDGAFNRYAIDQGTSWTVRLTRGDDASALSGASALAHQYCHYP